MAALYDLTSANKTSVLYFKYTIDTTRDSIISFDYNCKGPGISGSEGFCLFFVDCITDYLTGGSPGPGLGYTSLTANSGVTVYYKGINKGVLGIGFDITGNFGSDILQLDGYEVGIPNSISLRGSQDRNYDLLYRTEGLASSSFKYPFSLYKQEPNNEFNVFRVRITDLGETIVLDHNKGT